VGSKTLVRKDIFPKTKCVGNYTRVTRCYLSLALNHKYLTKWRRFKTSVQID